MFAMDIMLNGTADEKLEWMFLVCDADGDGEVTKKEMTDLVTVRHPFINKVIYENIVIILDYKVHELLFDTSY